MNTYEYRCDAAVHRAVLSASDSALLRAVHAFYQGWRASLFSAIRPGRAVRLPREDVLVAAQAFAGHLEADEAVLSYEYSFQVTPPGSQQARNDTDLILSVGGRPRLIHAGFGVASAYEMSSMRMDGATADALAQAGKMKPFEAERFRKSPVTIHGLDVIHDLRNMKPFVTDDGHTIQAVREPRPTNLVAIVREISDFIEKHPSEYVEVTYIEPPQE